MAGVTAAIVTVASVSSVAYQLTRLMIYKAAETATTTAIALLRSQSHYGDSTGRVQFVLMELDIEAKFKTVRSLLNAIEGEYVVLPTTTNDYIQIAVNNVRDAMDEITLILTRVQEEMDAHATRWFNSWRSMNVVDDLELLKAECRMFDKRLETLINMLSVPSKGTSKSNNSKEQIATHQFGLMNHKIFVEESATFSIEASREEKRLKNKILADQAYSDDHKQKLKSNSTATGKTTTRVIFEDPVFL